ncbi:hypothetical protein B0H10DRAFT_1943063 [Mycena sp. CBHHK59/15]|nr:hypothetical protein B0H10DRAFT_1943063 [Mycena sp. CBHHK59/15]
MAFLAASLYLPEPTKLTQPRIVMGVSVSAGHFSFYPPPPMDDEPHSEPEFAAESSLDDRGPLPHAYTSTFFSKSKCFIFSGGNFTNVNEPGPSQPPGIALDQHTMSAFFPNSKDFVVMGGTFTNTNQVAPRTPSGNPQQH